MGALISRFVKGAFSLATNSVYRLFALKAQTPSPNAALDSGATRPEEIPLKVPAASPVLNEQVASHLNAQQHHAWDNVSTATEEAFVVPSTPPASTQDEASKLVANDMSTRLQQVIAPVVNVEAEDVSDSRIKKLWDKHGEALVEGSSKVLKIVNELASDIPLVGTVLDPVLKVLGAAKTNFGNFKEAGDIVDLLRKILEYLAPSLSGGVSMRARKNLLTFEGDLGICVTRLAKFYQQTKLVQLVKAEKLTKELEDIRRDIDFAIQMLTTAGVLGMELEIMRKLQVAQDEASQRLAIEETSLLRQLHPLEAAHWKFSSMVEPCLLSTRLDVIQEIVSWAENASGPQVLLLTGQFGTGKSAIAKSACQILDDRDLLATSFFAQATADGVPVVHGQLGRIICTMSYFLGMTHSGFRHAVVQALIKNPALSYADTSQQATKLLFTPFQESHHPPGVIVIDGLNYLLQEDNIAGGDLVRQLQASCPSHMKLLLCGSGNHGVRSQITALNPEDWRIYDLQDVPQAKVAEDIRRVYVDCLATPHVRARVSSSAWPPQDDVNTLVDYTGSVFAFAAAAKRYISSPRHSPALRLQEFVRSITDVNAPQGHFDMLYRLILQDAVMVDDGPSRNMDEDLCLRVHNVLAGVILAQEPIDTAALAMIAQVSDAELGMDLVQLSPVLCHSPDFKDDIRIFHVSFQNYILSSTRCFTESLVIRCDIEHHRIARRCFHFMNTSFDPNAQDTLPQDRAVIRYACLYAWSHLVLSSAFQAEAPSEDLETSLATFCNLHLSRWLHELSSLGALPASMEQINTALKFLRDAEKRAVGTSQQVAVKCIQQLQAVSESSSGFTTPSGHKLSIKSYCLPNFTSMSGAHRGTVIALAGSASGLLTSSGSEDTVHAWPEGPFSGIDPLILPPKRAGHSRSRRLQSPTQSTTFALAFAPDGGGLISGYDNTLQVRDPVLPGPSRVISERKHHVVAIAVARDDDHVAFVSNGLRLWSRSSQEQIWHAKGYKAPITSISISLNNKYIAAGSSDNTIAITRFANGEVRHRLLEHTGPVRSVACSPRQTFRLVSASDDETVRVWDAESGTQVRVIVGHTAEVVALAWATTSEHVISGARDCTVRMWDPQSGQQTFLISGLPSPVSSLATFPVGDRAAIGCEDGSIHTWRWDCELEGGNDVVLMAAVPHCTLFAACTRQGLVYLIDVHTGDIVQVIVSAQVRALESSPQDLRYNDGGTTLTLTFTDGTSVMEQIDPYVHRHSASTAPTDDTVHSTLRHDGWLYCTQGTGVSYPICWIPPSRRLRQYDRHSSAVWGTYVAVGGDSGAFTVLDCAEHEMKKV